MVSALQCNTDGQSYQWSLTYCNGTDVFILSSQLLALPPRDTLARNTVFIFGHAIFTGTNIFALTLAFVLFCGKTCGSM